MGGCSGKVLWVGGWVGGWDFVGGLVGGFCGCVMAGRSGFCEWGYDGVGVL